MGDAGRAAGQEQRYAEAAAAFGPAIERLARAYERDPDRRRDLLADAELLSLWQQQTRDQPMMPPDDTRTQAERLDARARRRRVITVVVFILLLIKGALEVWIQTETLERAGDLLMMAALVYVAYRYRKWRLAAPPVALGSTTCVDFYRAELVRQRDLSKDSWGYLLPFVPGVALALFGGGLEDRPTSHMIALVALGVGLFLGIAGWNAHTVRKLQHEIDARDAS
jgi:hypothetical protein